MIVQGLTRDYAANPLFPILPIKNDANSEIISIFWVRKREIAFIRHAENAKDREHGRKLNIFVILLEARNCRRAHAGKRRELLLGQF